MISSRPTALATALHVPLGRSLSVRRVGSMGITAVGRRGCSTMQTIVASLPQPVQLRTSGDPRRTWGAWTADQMPPQDGKVFIVTGATSGMGKVTAENIAKRGGHVIIASRNLQKAQQAAEQVKQTGARGEVEGMLLDQASFKSIVDFADAFKKKGLPLHVLVNNAGVFLPPFARTQEGFEQTLGINYFGHVLLTHLLLDKLKQTAAKDGEARIVNMASLFELFGGVNWSDLGGRSARDSSLLEYGSSKLMTIMEGRELNKRLRGTGVEVFMCQPGLVQSPLTTQKLDYSKIVANAMDISARIYGWGPERGSLCLQRAATDPQLKGRGGCYLTPPFIGLLALDTDHAGLREPSNPMARNERAWMRLYEASLQLINQQLQSQQLPRITAAELAKVA